MFDLTRLNAYIGTAKCDRYNVLREVKAEVEALRAERDKLKAENDWLHRQLGGFTSNA